MASVALVALATWAEAGPIIISIAGAVGAYLDNVYLFPEDDQPKQPNLQLQNTAEGGPALGFIGQECRVRGQVIFMSPTYGSGTDPKVDVAIAVANDGTIISSGIGYVIIYAEGYEIFNGEGTIRSGKLDNISITHNVVSQNGNSVVRSPSGGFDLGRFRANKFGPNLKQAYNLSMSGWLDAGNNWGSGGGLGGNELGIVIGVERRGDGSTILWAHRKFPGNPPQVRINEIASSSVTPQIEQTFPPVNPAFSNSLDFKSGAAGQTVSSKLDIYDADVSGMERTAYFVIEGFRLAQFGNRLPDIVSVASSSSTPVTIAQAIETIFERAGWVKGPSELRDWDTTNLDPIVVRGYTMTEEGSIHARLQPLFFAYDITAQIQDGVIVFFHPDDARVFIVDENDWGAVSEDPLDDGLIFRPLTSSALPTKVSVNFVDVDNGWEDASIDRHVSSPGIVSEDTMEIDLRSLSLTMVEAIEIGERLLWRPRRLGRPWAGTLPPIYHYILEGDIITTQFNSRTIQLVVQKAERGADRTIHLEGRVYLPDPPRSRGF